MKTFCGLRCALTRDSFGGDANEPRTKENPNYSARTLDSAGFTRCASSLSVLRGDASCRLPLSSASAHSTCALYSRPRHRCALLRRAQPPKPYPVAHNCDKKQGQDKYAGHTLAFFLLCARGFLHSVPAPVKGCAPFWSVLAGVPLLVALGGLDGARCRCVAPII